MRFSPSQSTPGGCFIAFLGLFPAAFGILGAWGLVRWFALPMDRRVIDDTFWTIVAALSIGWGVAIILWVVAFRILRNTDFRGYRSRDPDRRSMKW